MPKELTMEYLLDRLKLLEEKLDDRTSEHDEMFDEIRDRIRTVEQDLDTILLGGTE